MTESNFVASAAEEGVYEAFEGQAFDVYGVMEEVVDLDGSTVTIERAYPDAPRRQSFLGVGERGNVVTSD
jgi:hypothetical protein